MKKSYFNIASWFRRNIVTVTPTDYSDIELEYAQTRLQLRILRRIHNNASSFRATKLIELMDSKFMCDSNLEQVHYKVRKII
jgi:hypothetical protein